jgi:EAL domain-containing protein (putative c-di-GMP-specific phosphodiesterase class I)
MQITSLLIAMAKNLISPITAEGIETVEQLAFLPVSGCDYGQDCLLSKPLNSDRLISFYPSYKKT